MPNNNVAILSIMSKFDEKSAREAAKRADKVYEEALSDIGNVNFDKKLIENFDRAMNLLKNKFKKVNLSSYTNSLLDSIFSDKDIKEKSKDIESFINKIEMLKKASTGQDINAFNTFSAKQIDALISRTEKLAQKQEEINEKTREYNREATKIAKANRSISTIDKNYGNQDYSKTLESLKKSLGTEKEFTAEQNQSIENLAKMVNLYQVMEKSEPQKGTAEAIRYSKDLLAVTQKIKEERDKIDAFSQKGASTYIANNGLSSVDKVSDYTVSKSKEDFVKASLSNLKSQEAKLQSELTTYISDSVQKNLAKVSKEVDAVVDKAEKRVENLQNKIESLQAKSTKTGSDNSIIGSIVSEADIKSLEEIEDRLFAIQDKYLEVDENGYATNDLSTKELKEFISLYKEYEHLPSDNKFESDLPDTYKSIIESDENLQKYADTLDKTINKQKELNTVKSNENEVSVDTQTEQLVKQEEQIKETIQAEKQLQDTQEKVSSNTKISVDAEQAIADINKIKESLDSIPEEKNIKITISDSDYTNTPLLSDAEGNTITAFRGVVGAWSGLINQDGIGFFTDKLKLAADYADSLAESGKVYQANLSFKNPLEVEGNGAKWDEIDFNGVKKTTDEIVELAKQLGYDGVIFKNIRDGFTDTDEDISNVMVALNAAQIKNEQVIGTVKAGTGEMVDVASKIDNATDAATNSTVESQNKIQEELKETQKITEQVSEAMNNVGSDKSNISSENLNSGNVDNVTNSLIEEQKAVGELDMVFRGLEGSLNGFMSNSGRLATFFTTSPLLARQYADSLGGVYQAMVALGKSLDINAEGRDWNAVEYLGDGSDEASRKIIELRKQIDNLYEQLNASGASGTGLDGLVEENRGDFSRMVQLYGDAGVEYNSYIEAVEKGNVIENQENQTVKQLMIQLYELEKAYRVISDAKDNVYGTHTTDEFAELAKVNGYDSVMFRNIKDSFDRTKNLTDVGVIFDESQIASVKNVSNIIDDLVQKIDGIKTQHGLNLPINIELPKEISRLSDGNFVNNLTGEIYDDVQKAIDSLKELDVQIESTSPIKDVFQGEAEKSGMDAIASATDEAVQSKKDFATANEGVQSSIDGSKSPLQLEAELMNQIAKSAREAADAKKEFVEANKQVKDIVADTNEEKKIENTEENANAWKELTYSIQRYSEVSRRISSGKALEGDIEEASRLENKISQLQKLDILSPTQIEKSEQMLTKLYDSLDDIEKKSKETTLESLNSSIDKYRNDYNSRSSKPIIDNQSDEYKKLLANYETSIKELEAYRDKIRNNPLVSKEDLNQIDELTKKVKENATAFNSLTASQKGSTPLSRGKTIEWANDLLEQNSKWSKKAKIEVQGWINKLATADPSNVEEIRNRILEIVRAEREAGNAGKTWLDIFSTKKLHNFLGQAASMFSFYDLVNVGREIVTNIKEVDTALTELRKVSDATEQRLTTNFKNSADTAKELGATVSDVISATADWSRMGYNIDQAEELARISTLYKNVGDGIDIETANNSLISTLQGFQLDASEAETIIDKFNEVANNYAIDSAGIGEALQRSAASFNAANTDLSKSIALITATNEVVQDPDSVGKYICLPIQ